MSVFPNGNPTPMSTPDDQGVSVNIRLPQKSLAVLLGFCLSFGFGFAAANSQSQSQIQKQSQSQTQVSNCNVEQPTTKAPIMPSPRKD